MNMDLFDQQLINKRYSNSFFYQSSLVQSNINGIKSPKDIQTPKKKDSRASHLMNVHFKNIAFKAAELSTENFEMYKIFLKTVEHITFNFNDFIDLVKK